MPQLNDLQRWFFDAVTMPADATAVAEHIAPTAQQSAEARLGVYQHAYVARLLEVLENIFPCTRFAVGDDLFRQFAAGYIQAHPPSSYTLARLADRFAAYLDQTRPADWGGFVVELMRLEEAIDRVFDGAGPERLPPFELPAGADQSLTLRFVPGFELHRFAHPVSTFFSAWKAGKEPGWPARQELFVALYRRDYIVRRYELSAAQHAFLSAIQDGASVGDAVETAARNSPQSVDQLAGDLRQWLRLWAAERFFA